jgi:hypothetical protein
MLRSSNSVGFEDGVYVQAEKKGCNGKLFLAVGLISFLENFVFK